MVDYFFFELLGDSSFVLVFSYFELYSILFMKLKMIQKHQVNMIKKTGRYVLLFCAAWFVIHAIFIIVDGLSDDIEKADVIVIFGNKVEENGVPSQRLQNRLERGISLYEQGISPRIIVSGGLGKEGFEETLVMKEYLMDNAVPEETIIVDTEGYDTYQTARNVKEIMEENNMTSIIIVSQYYHITRAKLAFHRFGIRDVYTAHAVMFPELRDIYSIPREIIGYYYYLFRQY